MAKPGKKFSLKRKKKYKIEGLSKGKPPAVSSLEAKSPETPVVSDPDVVDILYAIGDTPENARVAKRVATLMRIYPQMSLPEGVTHDWLTTRGHNFIFQPNVLGGRARGGMIPDFVLGAGNRGGMAWLVQGEYFHGKGFQSAHGQEGRDVRAELLLRGRIVDGVRIDTVVQIWEGDIYERKEDVLNAALSGITL